MPLRGRYDIARRRFNGTIDKLTYNLGPSQVTAEDQRKVQDAIAKVEN
jgi:hypothetical protein